MAYRETRGIFAPANHLVELKHLAKSRAAESAHLQAVQPVVETSRVPGADAHVRFNAKRVVQREMEVARLDHENMLLLSRLHATTVRPPSAVHRDASRDQRSMNVRTRRAELVRIERENMVRGGSRTAVGAVRLRTRGAGAP